MESPPTRYSMLSHQFFGTGEHRAASVSLKSTKCIAETQNTVLDDFSRPPSWQVTKECQPLIYSMFSQRFFVTESTERLGLRRSRSTFVDLPSSLPVVNEQEPRSATFCGLADDRDSYLSSTSSSQDSSPPSEEIRLQGWMYWARRVDNVALEAESYTKVYAVLRNEFLLLYRYDQRPSKHLRLQPLVQIAVASSWRSVSGVLHVKDPYEKALELYLYGPEDFDMCRRWGDALELASELTQAYLSSFKGEELPQDSLYRGTLHQFRSERERSIRQVVPQLKQMKTSLRRLIPTRV